MSDELVFNVFDTREFYKDFLRGMSINRLSKKYLISKSRVYKLIAETSRYQTVNKLNRWLALLETDGIDSKNMVATDIQQLLKEINY